MRQTNSAANNQTKSDGWDQNKDLEAETEESPDSRDRKHRRYSRHVCHNENS